MKKISSALFFLIFLSILTSCGAGRPEGESDETSYATPAPEDGDESPLAVYTRKAVEEPFFTGIESSGLIKGLRETDVISETTGLIRAVNFQIGNYVEKGHILVEVEDELPRINYESSQQDLKTAELEFDALKKSFDSGGTSLVVYNQGLTRLTSARLRLAQARKAYENTKIRAPFAGYISSRDSDIETGGYLRNGTAVTHIVDRSSYRIRLTVGENEISRISEGSPATVRVNALPDSEISATVLAVSPGALINGGGFPVVVGWDNGDTLLKSGLSARVSIDPDVLQEKQMIVPASALVQRDGVDYVFRVVNGRAEAVELRVLRTLGDRAAVAQAAPDRPFLEEGEDLVVSGLNSLVPGDSVNPTVLER